MNYRLFDIDTITARSKL